MKTKRTVVRTFLPARLAEYKPGKAIVRRLCDWLTEIPEDHALHGITPERSLELRFSLILLKAWAEYCLPGHNTDKTLPTLLPREIAELDSLYRAVSFRPLQSADTITLALSPLNDNEATYWSLLQDSAEAALYYRRAEELEVALKEAKDATSKEAVKKWLSCFPAMSDLRVLVAITDYINDPERTYRRTAKRIGVSAKTFCKWVEKFEKATSFTVPRPKPGENISVKKRLVDEANQRLPAREKHTRNIEP